jgi:hypothetical protein
MAGKRRAWLFAAVGAVLIVVGIAAYEIFGAYHEIVAGLCGTIIRHVIPAPNATASAVVFERDCGATTNFSTQISIVPTGAVFSAEKHPAFFVVGGRHDLVPRWNGGTEIEIAVPQGEKVYRKESHVNGIEVTYY